MLVTVTGPSTSCGSELPSTAYPAPAGTLRKVNEPDAAAVPVSTTLSSGPINCSCVPAGASITQTWLTLPCALASGVGVGVTVAVAVPVGSAVAVNVGVTVAAADPVGMPVGVTVAAVVPGGVPVGGMVAWVGPVGVPVPRNSGGARPVRV